LTMINRPSGCSIRRRRRFKPAIEIAKTLKVSWRDRAWQPVQQEPSRAFDASTIWRSRSVGHVLYEAFCPRSGERVVTGSVENAQVRYLRGGYGTSNQRGRYMFSAIIEGAGQTNSPKNVPDPVLRHVFYCAVGK
jgi:hypothetical protein